MNSLQNLSILILLSLLTPLQYIKATKNKDFEECLNYLKIDLKQKANKEVKQFYQACFDGKQEKLKKPQLEKNILYNGFYIACYNGQLNTAKLLVKQNHLDINHTNTDKRSVLHIACRQGHKELVEWLLPQPKVNINLQDLSGNTPLSAACAKNKIDIVQTLLGDKNIDVNKANKFGQTPLYNACWEQYENIVALLIQSGADVNKATNDGRTPTYKACEIGNKEILQHLIKAGADVNKELTTDQEGTVSHKNYRDRQSNVEEVTPFAIAYYEDHRAIVEMLIPMLKKEDIRNKRFNGQSILGMITQKNDKALLALLFKNFQKEDLNIEESFFSACKYGREQVVEFWLEKQMIAANQLDDKGNFAFCIASERNHLEIIEILLKYMDEKQINQQNKKGETAFYTACKQGNDKIVDYLMKQPNLDINLANYNGKTPLYASILQGNSWVTEALLKDKRIDMSASNKQNALFEALFQTQNIKAIDENNRKLEGLDNKPDRDTIQTKQEKHQESKMHIAKLLLNKLPIDTIHQKNQHGQTPYDIAANKNPAIVKLFEEKLNQTSEKPDFNKTAKESQIQHNAHAEQVAKTKENEQEITSPPDTQSEFRDQAGPFLALAGMIGLVLFASKIHSKTQKMQALKNKKTPHPTKY
ncbi:MAG: ankyrin repeat domain-containing protein [Bacteroidota bacterium]